LSPGKEASVPIQRLGGPQNRVERCGEEKNFFSLQGIDLAVVQVTLNKEM
jgi:hypothetical protein